jgi:hypothetical protein
MVLNACVQQLKLFSSTLRNPTVNISVGRFDLGIQATAWGGIRPAASKTKQKSCNAD